MKNKLVALFNFLDENCNKFDALMVVNSKIRFYYTNFSSTDGILLIHGQEATLFVDFRYFEEASLVVKNCKVVLCNNLFDELNSFCKKYGFKKIAISSQGICLDTFLQLKEKINEVDFILNKKFDEKIINQQTYKSKYEISNIIAAQKIAEEALEKVLDKIKPGVSELHIARLINSYIYSKTNSYSFETIVVSGARTSLPHGKSTDKLIELGDFIIIDLGAIVNGYCSDMTRTICVGEPSNFQKEIYKIVLSAQEEAINLIEIGKKCKEVDLYIREYFKKYGFDKEFGHSLGHGVGLQIHEKPFISSSSCDKFEEDMVFTIEPGLYFNNKLGVRIEDLILIEKGKVVNLTHFQKNLISLY